MIGETLLREELLALQQKDLYRQLRTLESISSTRAIWNQHEYLLFCGNDYLGLAHHPAVVEATCASARRWGVGAGAARLVSGHSSLHQQLETALAQWKKKERALVYSAGYMANLGVLSALAEEQDLIVMDKLCHASLIDGARMSRAALRVFPHRNYEKCAEILEKGANFRRRFLVSDTVFSMDGDLADLKTLAMLRQKYACWLFVDDAHGTGVLGYEGGGAAEDLALESEIDVMTGTLSKSLGCLGGFVAASETVIEYLINRSRPFIYATALPPMLCQAAFTAMEIARRDRTLRMKLWQNVQKLHEGLLALGFPMAPIASPILPILIGGEKEALEFSHALLEQGIFVPAMRYPTVAKGKARLRVTASAAHEEADLNRLLEALKRLRLYS